MQEPEGKAQEEPRGVLQSSSNHNVVTSRLTGWHGMEQTLTVSAGPIFANGAGDAVVMIFGLFTKV